MNEMFRAGDERQHLEDDIRTGAFKMVKCQCCHEQEAVYAWQPFGPGEDANTFMLLGSHYRGYPVIKTCHTCTTAFMSDDFPVYFTYKSFRYVGQNHEVREVKPTFWDGGTTALNLQGSATMIMKDTPDGSDLVALVADPAFITSFVATPDLIDACEKIAQAFSNDDKLTTAQALALASVRNVLDSLRRK